MVAPVTANSFADDSVLLAWVAQVVATRDFFFFSFSPHWKKEQHVSTQGGVGETSRRACSTHQRIRAMDWYRSTARTTFVDAGSSHELCRRHVQDIATIPHGRPAVKNSLGRHALPRLFRIRYAYRSGQAQATNDQVRAQGSGETIDTVATSQSCDAVRPDPSAPHADGRSDSAGSDFEAASCSAVGKPLLRPGPSGVEPRTPPNRTFGRGARTQLCLGMPRTLVTAVWAR